MDTGKIEPVFVAIASAGEKEKEVLAAVLPEAAHIFAPKSLGPLYYLLADVPIDLLVIDDTFDGQDVPNLIPRLKTTFEDLVILVMVEEQPQQPGSKIRPEAAFDILVKPLEKLDLQQKVQKALEHARLLRNVRLIEEKNRKSGTRAEHTHPSIEATPPHANKLAGPLRQFFEASLNLQDMNKMIDLLLHSFAEHFMAGKAAAVVLDEEKGKLEMRACRGLDEDLLKTLEFSLFSGIYSWLRKTHRLLLTRELPDVTELQALALDREAKLLHAEVIVPLLGRTNPIGFFSLGGKFSGRPFSNEETDSMFYLARHAGCAIENALVLQKTRTIAVRDELTQLYNRHFWKKSLESEVERSKRYDRPLSIALFDIDHFKTINDVFGHQAGDDVLKGLARYLLKSSRHTDVVGRYGGEEFIVILPETTAEYALLYCERLRQDVEQRLGDRKSEDFLHRGLTISGGLTACDRKNDAPAALIERADRALYRAKHEGRNRINQMLPP